MLSPDWLLCGTGRSQSPVDLGGGAPAGPAEPRLDYEPSSLRIVHGEHVVDVLHNGHTIQVRYDEGSTLEMGGQRFESVQYHFHAPSEHTVDGRHFAMEMHLAHASATGELAVVGVLIDAGASNATFDAVWPHLPERAGQEVRLEHVRVDIDQLLPGDRRSYRYSGSLTTPPCSDGVRWLVFVEPIALGEEQIQAFRDVVGDNSRPVQPLGDRMVRIDTTPVR